MHLRSDNPAFPAERRVARGLLQGASMSKPHQLPTITDDALAGTTGGATRERSSSTDRQLQQTLQSITDSLSDLKSQSSTSSLSKMLPVMLVAKVMRDR